MFAGLRSILRELETRVGKEKLKKGRLLQNPESNLIKKCA